MEAVAPSPAPSLDDGEREELKRQLRRCQVEFEKDYVEAKGGSLVVGASVMPFPISGLSRIIPGRQFYLGRVSGVANGTQRLTECMKAIAREKGLDVLVAFLAPDGADRTVVYVDAGDNETLLRKMERDLSGKIPVDAVAASPQSALLEELEAAERGLGPRYEGPKRPAARVVFDQLSGNNDDAPRTCRLHAAATRDVVLPLMVHALDAHAATETAAPATAATATAAMATAATATAANLPPLPTRQDRDDIPVIPSHAPPGHHEERPGLTPVPGNAALGSNKQHHAPLMGHSPTTQLQGHRADIAITHSERAVRETIGEGGEEQKNE